MEQCHSFLLPQIVLHVILFESLIFQVIKNGGPNYTDLGSQAHFKHPFLKAEARHMKMEDDRAYLAALLQTNLFSSSHFTTTLNIFWTAL